jgi:hypothetical protein
VDIWKTPLFGRLRPETRFDLHCVVELAARHILDILLEAKGGWINKSYLVQT